MIEFNTIVSVCSGIGTIIGLLTLFITPIRDKVFKTKQKEKAEKEREEKTDAGMKCLLRSEMLQIYYKNLDRQQLRQHERENFDLLYQSYKAMGGNSFIDSINGEVQKWKVVT